MVEKRLNNTTPYGEIRASHEGSLHSSTLKATSSICFICFRLRGSPQLYEQKVPRRNLKIISSSFKFYTFENYRYDIEMFSGI